MHLESMKLSGFKTFVDPTTVVFESNRTAVVGPNGSGKSNIVDAIHFVLGSTSKNLRAEMMAHVIFNGTDTRKPVGQASVELIFDNSDGKAGGEYAAYPKISIRREINRDGESKNYLNGTRCRRRDITDLLLGTGLGQNNNAIIQQGMIAHLIEAKPEVLRVHVEEAAGTSKYKERRKETENRLKHTRENMDRLNDHRDEQGKQLNHLQRQSEAAQRFKTLKTKQRLLRAQLHALFSTSLDDNVQRYTHEITIQENALEANNAQITHTDKELEIKRSLRSEQNDQINDIQSVFYQIGSEITRIEQQTIHAKERKRQLEEDYLQLENAFQDLSQTHLEDQQQFEELTLQLTQAEQQAIASKQAADDVANVLKASEDEMQQWQFRWDDFNQTSAQSSKQEEVERTKIQHLEQKQQSILQRIARIRDEESQQNYEPIVEEVELLQSHQTDAQLQLEALREQLDLIQDNIQSERTKHLESNQTVASMTKALRDLQARNASLEALQLIALGKSDQEVNSWLHDHELSQYPRLAQGLKVESGWEVAIETVLDSHLDAICVTDFKPLDQAILNLKQADITFFNTSADAGTVVASTNDQLVPLQAKVTSNWSIANLLQHIYVVADLEEGLSKLSLLQPHESFITADGIWLSLGWLKVSRSVHQKSGVLQREKDIAKLQEQIAMQQSTLEKEEKSSVDAQERLNEYTHQRETLQHQYQALQAKNSDLLAQIRAKEGTIERLKQKQASLSSEIKENDQLFVEVESTLEMAKAGLITIGQQATYDRELREEYLLEREQLNEKLSQLRRQTTDAKQQANEDQIRLESMRNQLHFLQQNMVRAERQLASAQERRVAIEQSLQDSKDPLPELAETLQANLEQRAEVEMQLSAARQTFDELENEISQLEKNRHQTEQSLLSLRNQLENYRLECQSFKVKQATHLEQIQESGFTIEELIAQMPEDANINGWEEEIGKIEGRIHRLGPINLAAIEEYEQLLERKEYLDKQHDDLLEAMTTLENAIKKIDHETQARFKETFNQMNESFKRYFKEIFGGGQAYLELTSDDLLETGVVVKAQPPGKKNSTIHLLSGGEKALTAIALVFSIFDLNPAPFCVLDEVDAPLDDANVSRFCNLVTKMSEKVQFIFISHNKITIEMAQQLAGVTMQEPGVSRLVSVDIDQAIGLATA